MLPPGLYSIEIEGRPAVDFHIDNNCAGRISCARSYCWIFPGPLNITRTFVLYPQSPSVDPGLPEHPYMQGKTECPCDTIQSYLQRLFFHLSGNSKTQSLSYVAYTSKLLSGKHIQYSRRNKGVENHSGDRHQEHNAYKNHIFIEIEILHCRALQTPYNRQRIIDRQPRCQDNRQRR